MGNARSYKKLLFGLLSSCYFVGCMTFGPSPMPEGGAPDLFLEAILKQETVESKPGWSKLKTEAVLKEIPLATPLAQARTIMERHGFSCWAGLSDGKGEYLHCTAYKQKSKGRSEKIVVKLYYDTKRITDVEVTVEHDVLQPAHRSWGPFSTSKSKP